MNTPKKNIIIKNRTLLISYTLNVIEYIKKFAIITAKNATGVLLPDMQSERNPIKALPKIAPMSIKTATQAPSSTEKCITSSR